MERILKNNLTRQHFTQFTDISQGLKSALVLFLSIRRRRKTSSPCHLIVNSRLSANFIGKKHLERFLNDCNHPPNLGPRPLRVRMCINTIPNQYKISPTLLKSGGGT